MVAKNPTKKSSNVQNKTNSKESTMSQFFRRPAEEQATTVIKPQISIPETITAINNYPPLLRLPSEIRREILKYLIPSSTKKFRLYTDCDSSVITTKWNRQPHIPSNRDTIFQHNSRRIPPEEKLDLSILRTNRLIYYEALSILYSENLFHFIGFNYLPVLDFIRRLSPDAKNLVRKVRLTLLTDQHQITYPNPPPNHDAFCTVIHDFLPGLTTLQADPWIFF